MSEQFWLELAKLAFGLATTVLAAFAAKWAGEAKKIGEAHEVAAVQRHADRMDVAAGRAPRSLEGNPATPSQVRGESIPPV